ncbi:hypothetical protein COP2_009982 [Malus domestica]
MLEGNAEVRKTDMPEDMQSHAVELAYNALDLYEVSDFRSLITLRSAKQKVDEAYGTAWHCVVGKNFGSSITHFSGSFICLHVETKEFLVFKDCKNSKQGRSWEYCRLKAQKVIRSTSTKTSWNSANASCFSILERNQILLN